MTGPGMTGQAVTAPSVAEPPVGRAEPPGPPDPPAAGRPPRPGHLTRARARIRTWLSGLSLRRRVAFLTTMAVFLAVLATGLAGYTTLRYSLYRALDAELTTTATSLAGSAASDISNLGGLSDRALRIGNATVAAVRADGEVFYVPGQRTRLVISADDLAVAKLQTGVSVRTGVTQDGRTYRIAAVPIRDLGNYAFVLGRPLQPTNDTLTSLWVVLIAFGLAGVAGAAMAGMAVARSGLRPVRQLTEAVEHVARTDDLTPIHVSGSSELTRLAATFNRMLTSLALSRERQRRLIADAGHELRTPLTSLRTNIELLAADERTQMLKPEDRRAILADVTAQLAEFTSLIGDLVHLARDERVQAAPEPIDLRTVVNAALDRVRRRGKGLTFDVELNPYYVLGEAETLERAVTNLLDNAVKWSPPGGTVRVLLEGGRLRVSDQGPGIPSEDLPYVFDRFYRGEAARKTPGTGLGLSIVAQALNRHGGWVRAGHSAEGGAEFTIGLPGSTTLDGLSTGTTTVP